MASALSISAGIFDCSILAGVYAVHTAHAAAVVNAVLLHIDAGCLALFSAKTAVAALVCIDDRGENAES